MTPSSSNPTVDHQAAAGDDRVGGNNKKLSNKQPEGAAAKECSPRRQSEKNRSNNNKNENPKRRRRHNPRPRSTNNIIPEPHVVQEPLNCISDHDDDKRGYSTTKATCVLRAAAIARRLQAEEEERLLQESIERHTTLLTPERNPEFFVRVYRKNRGEEWLEWEMMTDGDGETALGSRYMSLLRRKTTTVR
jgi:hypothetical protein